MNTGEGIPPHSRRRESIAPEAADGVHTDLHISILPKSFWNGELNCAPYQAVADAVTIGFVRAHVNSSVIALREEIATQLADDKNLPNSYIFLKGVGRALVPIRPKQETLLTIDNFKSIGSRMPPEIVLLDASSLSQAHSQRLHMGSKTHLLPRRSRDIIHHDNDSSSLENASDLRDRVNKGVRERMQNRAKPNPSKIQAPPPRIQMNPGMKRGNTHDGAASVDSTPRELGRYRKPNDGKRDGAGSRVSTNTKSSAPAGQKRKNSVRFPPVTDLEQHNYMTDEREPDYDTNGTPRNYPLPQKSQKPRQIQHGKPSKGGQVPRRVEQIGHSTDSEDELPPLRGSVQSNYSAPEKVTKTRKSQAKPIRASGAANKSKIPGKVSAPSPRTSNAVKHSIRKSKTDIVESESEDEGISSGTISVSRETKLKAQRKSQMRTHKAVDSSFTADPVSSDGYGSNPSKNFKLPPIKPKDRTSYAQRHSESKKTNSNVHGDGTHSEPHRVESYEEFYRRKSVQLGPEAVETVAEAGTRCPDCGLMFKAAIDAKRHFNLIHRTSKAALEARKRRSELERQKKDPTRFGKVITGFIR